MTVDAELQKILARATEAPPLNRLSVADARDVFRKLAQERIPLAPAVPYQDIVIGSAGAQIEARLYEPENAPAADLLVFFHGGGFVLGGIQSHDPLCRRLAATAPVRILSVGYRLGPEHKSPAAYLDGISAVSWAFERRSENGRVYLAGDSAGGNIACWTALDARIRDRGSVDGLVLIYPNVAFDHRSPSREAYGEGYLLTGEDLRLFRSHFLQDAPDRSLLDTDPVGLPPTIMVTAGYDPLCDEGRALASHLATAGVSVRELHFPTLVHGFATMSHLSRAAQSAVQDIGAAIAALRRSEA